MALFVGGYDDNYLSLTSCKLISWHRNLSAKWCSVIYLTRRRLQFTYLFKLSQYFLLLKISVKISGFQYPVSSFVTSWCPVFTRRWCLAFVRSWFPTVTRWCSVFTRIWHSMFTRSLCSFFIRSWCPIFIRNWSLILFPVLCEHFRYVCLLKSCYWIYMKSVHVTFVNRLHLTNTCGRFI